MIVLVIAFTEVAGSHGEHIGLAWCEPLARYLTCVSLGHRRFVVVTIVIAVIGYCVPRAL